MEIGIGLGITRFPGWGVMNIGQLFASGEQGAWYDPSDMSTLFQDSAGTVPVTAVEQPVGRILDKSGRGNHASQATTTKRPVLKIDAGGRYYLSFDGVDDALQTGNIDFTGTDKMTVWAGVTPGSVAANAMLLELSDISNANDGAFKLLVPETYGDPNVSSSSRGTSANASDQGVFSTTISTASPLVISTAHDISGDRTTLSVNGVAYSPAIGDKGAGSFGNYPLYIGARAGTFLYFNGRLYGLTVRGAQSTLSQIEATELYVKQKMRLP